MHISFVVCHGSLFVHRQLASVGMPRTAAGDDFAGRMANPGRPVALGPEFHADLEFWRWFVDKRVEVTRAAGCCRRRCIICWSAWHNVRCSRTRQKGKNAVGGYCLETSVYWRHDLTAQE